MTSCSACEGGMVQVDPEGYAELQWPYPENATPEEIAQTDAKRQDGKIAYRPCGDCRPDQFARWAAGCFRTNHRAATCDLCIEAMGEKAAASHDRGATRR